MQDRTRPGTSKVAAQLRLLLNPEQVATLDARRRRTVVDLLARLVLKVVRNRTEDEGRHDAT